MMLSAPGNNIVRPNVADYTKGQIIFPKSAGWTPLGWKIKFEQTPIPDERIMNVQRNKSLGTDSGSRLRVMSFDIEQDICFDNTIGDLLKDITEKFRGSLKQKIIDNIKYTESIETVLLSESSLAKEWLTDEEAEAWKDL